MSERKLKVLIVDDHPLMRVRESRAKSRHNGTWSWLLRQRMGEAVALLRQHRPDVSLMDVRMPGTKGIDAIMAIRHEFPTARIVVLTTYGGDVQAFRAFKAGAVGYLQANMLRTEQVDTIRLVHAGQQRIPPEVALDMAEHATDEAMTAREQQVLANVAKGHSNKIIAAEL